MQWPALALVCRAKGYRPLIVMADCFTEERFQLMRALGAEIDVVASVEGRPKVTAQDIHNMVARAEELAREPGHYATDQFNNPYVIPGHRDALGRPLHHPGNGAAHALAGTVGDLFESAVKRDMQVKDTGRLLGGHGGVLDRVVRVSGVEITGPALHVVTA